MAGGLMQIAAASSQTVQLTHNPEKSFFRATYKRYTNFALQKFSLMYEGSTTMQLSEPSTFVFKIKRYAPMLMDCYLSVDLPNIWSPIYPPQYNATTNTFTPWVPFEFKWIDNIGAKMIQEIRIVGGNFTLQKYSGDYLLAAVQRDFSAEKRKLFDEMIGNVPELTNPGNSGARVNAYPNAYFTANTSGSEPSIRGRTLYIPLNTWFGLNTKMAFPLIALQYNELQIHVTLRPINQLYQIRDVMDAANEYPYVAPNFNVSHMQLYRFLQTPPDISLAPEIYADKRSIWNSNIHLNCTYAYLSEEETNFFALNNHKYLIKQVFEHNVFNITGTNRVDLNSYGLISNWLFYFQRSDANLRNEWSNYTNWPYNYLPEDVRVASSAGTWPITRTDASGNPVTVYIGPGVNPDGTLTGLFTTPVYSPMNVRDILVSMGILLDGTYRENQQPVGVYDLIEKYTRTSGNAPPGLYCYNYALHSSNADIQPSGAIDMNMFTRIVLEFTTINPPLDPLAQSISICDPETGEVIGVNKPTWRIYDYNFNLYLAEERLNFVEISSGNVGLSYST